MIRQPVWIVERDDGEVICVCDHKEVADNISDIANSLTDDNGNQPVSSLVTEWNMNEMPDFLINRTYYVTIDGDNAAASLVDYDENYAINVIEQRQAKQTGKYTVYVYAESSGEAIAKAYELIADATVK